MISIVQFQVKDPNTPLMSPGLVTGKIQAPPQPVSNSFSNTNGYRAENGDIESSHEKNDFYKSSSTLLRYVMIQINQSIKTESNPPKEISLK